MKEAVIVKWIDAQRVEVGGIKSEEEIKLLEPLPCEMIGFKIFEDNTKIIIAQEWWEETSQIKYANIIPKESILKTRRNY
jgi:choline kinase